MGSFCGASAAARSTTTDSSGTQNQTFTPAGMSNLQDILQRAQSVASQPYSPFSGQMVAGLSPTQQAGIGNVNSAFGSALPYITQAGQYATQGAAPINPGQIQQYENPFTQNVIDATQANFNEGNAQQQSQVLGNAAMHGALGGDRVGVAQAELARQQKLAQDPVIAGLRSQGYTQALGAAQADRAAAGNAAFTFGNLGGETQNSLLQGAQAQIGAGGLEQQTNQAGLNAAYQQYLQKFAFPYQQAQFLAGIGLPAIGAMGGTTYGTQSGTQTRAPPAPSMFSQAAGLGLAGLGMFAKRGGRIRGFADGGVPNFIDISSYVPRPVQLNPGQSAHPVLSPMSFGSDAGDNSTAKNPFSPDSMAPYANAGKGLGSLRGKFSGGAGDFGGSPETNANLMPFGLPEAGYGTDSGAGGYAHGGFIDTVHAIRKSLKGYDDGGTVVRGPQTSGERFADRLHEAGLPSSLEREEVNSFPMGMRAVSEDMFGISPNERVRRGFHGISHPYGYDDGGAVSDPDQDGDPMGAMASASPSPFASAAVPSPTTPQGFSLMRTLGLGNGLSEDAKTSLMSAGLGMMAGTSPNAMTNIGAGGLQGVQTYNALQKQGQEQELKRMSVQMQARKMAQEAEQFGKTFGLKQQELGQRATQFGQTMAENRRQHDVTANRPVKVYEDPRAGSAIMGVPDPSRPGRFLDPVTGDLLVLPSQGRPSFPVPDFGGTPSITVPVPETPKTVAANEQKIVDPGSPIKTPFGMADDAAMPLRAIMTSGDMPQGLNHDVLNDPRLTPGDINKIKAIGEGRAAFLPIGRGNKENQFIMQKAYEYNPNLDQTMYNRRNRTETYFAVGTQGGGGQQVIALNRFAAHAASLYALAEKLDQGQFPTWNAVKNWVAKQGFSDQEKQDILGAWDVNAKGVGDEAAKVFAGSNPALADREIWHSVLQPDTPLSTIKAKLRQAVEMSGGALSALASGYNEGMRTNHSPREFLTPQTQRIFDAIQNNKPIEGAFAGSEGSSPKIGERKQFKQGWGVWNGNTWVPEKP